MAEWTAGKVFLIAAGAVGTGLLVRQLVGALRAASGGNDASGEGDRAPFPPPLPVTPQAPPAVPGPATEPPGQNWWQHRFDPLVERWRPEVERRAIPVGLPVNAILKWIAIESGGDMGDGKNMGGIPGREAGIFQLDFPGDAKYGATFEGLRQIAARSVGRGNAADLSWMSPDDLDQQVGAGIRKLVASRQTVRDVFARTGVAWPEWSADFGNAVKQMHAAPAV